MDGGIPEEGTLDEQDFNKLERVVVFNTSGIKDPRGTNISTLTPDGKKKIKLVDQLNDDEEEPTPRSMLSEPEISRQTTNNY